MHGSRLMVWALRAAWLGLAPAAGPALADALSGRSTPVQLVAAAGLWLGWAVGVVAVLVPTTVALTAIRLLAPGALVVTVAAGAAGAAAGWTAVAVAVAGATLVLAYSAEVGRAFVQGSAYGDETRFPLRPPGVLLPVLPLLWAVAAAGAGAGPLLLAARQWLAGALALAVGTPLAVVLVRRFHRLARRWVVLVPAGFVVHDDVALAETLLLRRPQLAAITLAPAATAATDLTMGAPGLALEVRATEPVPVTLAADVRNPKGRPVRAVALLVSPSRPGAVLEECTRRRLPAG